MSSPFAIGHREANTGFTLEWRDVIPTTKVKTRNCLSVIAVTILFCRSIELHDKRCTIEYNPFIGITNSLPRLFLYTIIGIAISTFTNSYLRREMARNPGNYDHLTVD